MLVGKELFRLLVFLGKVDPCIHLRSNLFEADIHQSNQLQSGELSRQSLQAVFRTGIVDVQTRATKHGHLESNGLSTLGISRAENPDRLQAGIDRISMERTSRVVPHESLRKFGPERLGSLSKRSIGVDFNRPLECSVREVVFAQGKQALAQAKMRVRILRQKLRCLGE